MDTLLYLVPALGCGLMMVACIVLMGRMHRPTDSRAADTNRGDDIAELRAEVARLRAERDAAEVGDADV